MQIFYDWCHKWSSFGVILAQVAWPRAQPLGRSVRWSFHSKLGSSSGQWAFDQLYAKVMI